MKFFALIAAASMATVAGFAPKGSAVRSTELYNYAPTKWSPRGGASPSSYGAPSSRAAPAAPAAANGASAPKNYSVTKWSPRGGSMPYGSAAPAAAASSPAVAAPAPAPAAPAGPTMADLAAQWAAMNKSN
mmetsp:Transcript_19866/g.37670  ORF Transcript_19866/g.37670 Transcript_19866/m.37670 type:complete len:131 (-) Transcript_19866:116-508(-)